jgi:MFS family permease
MTAAAQHTFYGWWIVAGSFLTLLVAVGLGIYAPPVFLVPLQEHFGWSRAAISGGPSLAALVTGLLSPVVGSWVDRYGPRRLMAFGAVVMAITFALFGAMQSLWQLYAISVIASLGVSCTAFIPNQTLISSWFERRAGLAMGIALAGIGIGGLTIAPLGALLIEQVGWRLAYVGLACLVPLVVLPTALLLVRNDPADLGLRPDGDATDADERAGRDGASEAKRAGLELSEALRSRNFWILALFNFLRVFGVTSLIGHLAAYLSDVGFERQLAAGALGFVVGVSVFGRLGSGFLADRLPRKWIACGVVSAQAAAMPLLFAVTSFGVLPAFVILFGLAQGGGAVLLPLLVGHAFGLRAFGRILGAMMIAATFGGALGPVLTGWIFDRTGSYELAFALHIGAFLTAAVAIQLLRPPHGGGMPRSAPRGTRD